jgi:hypothetical protein
MGVVEIVVASFRLKLKKKNIFITAVQMLKGICHRDYINEKEFLKEISDYFDEISLSQNIIQEITQYLKNISSFIKSKRIDLEKNKIKFMIE